MTTVADEAVEWLQAHRDDLTPLALEAVDDLGPEVVRETAEPLLWIKQWLLTALDDGVEPEVVDSLLTGLIEMLELDVEPETIKDWLESVERDLTAHVEAANRMREQLLDPALDIDLLPGAPRAPHDAPVLDGPLVHDRPALGAVRNPPAEKHPTDLGNAIRLRERHGTDVRYCYAWRRYLVWDGKRWGPDVRGNLDRWAKEVPQTIRRVVPSLKDKDERRKWFRWAEMSESAARQRGMIELLRSEVPAVPEELDQDPWLLNVENGTLDLRTGELRPHRREDMITKLAPVVYDPEAETPVWDAFLRKVIDGDNEMIEFLARMAGYCLTGSVQEQALLFPFGLGQNGKSTFIGTLRGVMGDYATTAPKDLLNVQYNEPHPTGLASLAGVRMAVASETTEGRRLDETFVKQVTGGDRLSARRMREDFFEFEPTHKLVMFGNYKPRIEGTDEAIWRRIKLIPFTVHISDEEKDPELLAKLKTEWPGILAWAVRGCLEWQKIGLSLPRTVVQATAAYRTESDVLGQFLEERCALLDTATEGSSELFRAFKSWCEDQGEKTDMTQKRLAMRLEERGLRKVPHSRFATWQGLKLRGR